MNALALNHWQETESGFDSFDGTRLFYRAWQPSSPVGDSPQRVLVFLHRGHEHSGRIPPLLTQLATAQDWAFAWDARGHGHSPGERGDADSFTTLVRDLDAFMAHLASQYQIEQHNILIVANSVGAVIAATWLHDYAPRIRGLIMAAAAFEIKLYVPLAKPALRLATCFKPDLFVTSYIRPSMLTHSAEEAQQYAADPLIAKSISARVLLELADTAQRIVADASAINVPVLMLVADKDYVVKEKPQQQFFQRLSSPLKRYVVIPDCHHAIFYEADTTRAFDCARQFIQDCFTQTSATTHQPTGLAQYQALLAGNTGNLLGNTGYALQRLLLRTIGRLSQGMTIGLQHGFDSGKSLDYVYRNQASGRWLIGRQIDRGYLDAIGWRGIRQRKMHLQHALSSLISQHPAGQPLRILDVAAGSGRYVLETLKRFQDRNIEVTLRDFEQKNLDDAKLLATSLQLATPISYQRSDAFDPTSYTTDQASYDIVIVSGLYELFSENALIATSLAGIRQLIKGDGHLIYTGQPWHPQLELIAKTLTNHRGQAWVMRPRPQAEMDTLVAAIGGRKINTQIGIAGIFSVSVAQFAPPAPLASG